MNAARRWLPHPLLSAVLLVAWLWLNNSIHPSHVLLGSLLSVAIPYFTRHFWPEPIAVDRPLRVIQYVAVVCYDVVLANLQLAVLILGPVSRLRPTFVRVPLDLRTDFAITVLASTVTLTPGTVSVDVEGDPVAGRRLVVHVLRCVDAEEMVRAIKDRYEGRLQEILEC
ncbi:MAG: Na+/H+ antiporter subunit E [Gammaproteobacteria bacterium]|nr:Na+/H+ antiporter subunit E [Gammaproteobacteria bacterium]MDH4310250.1 Na+/H+ antiporter subunit E [Gammaproteobacteria bacterium]MDH5272642.1 Na+/H+ antiporter subunit E [Gammaproteobacteria bacterium]